MWCKSSKSSFLFANVSSSNNWVEFCKCFLTLFSFDFKHCNMCYYTTIMAFGIFKMALSLGRKWLPAPQKHSWILLYLTLKTNLFLIILWKVKPNSQSWDNRVSSVNQMECCHSVGCLLCWICPQKNWIFRQ